MTGEQLRASISTQAEGMATTGSYNCIIGTYNLHNTESSTSKIFALA